MERTSIHYLGTRGSASVAAPQFARYGGATACLLLRMGGQHILLDGGSGLCDLPADWVPTGGKLPLLLSHPHVDHLCGIPCCPVLLTGQTTLQLYATPRDGLDARAQLTQLMSPPLWPVGPEVFSPPPSFHSITGDFSIGPVRVRVFDVEHPGGCTVFRLEHEGTSLVYATDVELSIPSALKDFAADCTLLLCDGQYTDEELPTMSGFGHSSWQQAVTLAKACNAERLGILHHAPWRTDTQLDAAEQALQCLLPNAFFARKGACTDL